jgi:hypothetical protein
MFVLFSALTYKRRDKRDMFFCLPKSAKPRPCLCLALQSSLRRLYVLLFLSGSAQNFRSRRLCSSLRVLPSVKDIARPVDLTASAIFKIITSRHCVVWLILSSRRETLSILYISCVGLFSILCRKWQISDLMAVPAFCRYVTKAFILCCLFYGIAKYSHKSGNSLPTFSARLSCQDCTPCHQIAVLGLSEMSQRSTMSCRRFLSGLIKIWIEDGTWSVSTFCQHFGCIRITQVPAQAQRAVLLPSSA